MPQKGEKKLNDRYPFSAQKNHKVLDIITIFPKKKKKKKKL